MATKRHERDDASRTLGLSPGADDQAVRAVHVASLINEPRRMTRRLTVRNGPLIQSRGNIDSEPRAAIWRPFLADSDIRTVMTLTF